jgi:hypothetical protein
MARPPPQTEPLGEMGCAEQRGPGQPVDLPRILDRMKVACGFIATEPSYQRRSYDAVEFRSRRANGEAQ